MARPGLPGPGRGRVPARGAPCLGGLLGLGQTLDRRVALVGAARPDHPDDRAEAALLQRAARRAVQLERTGRSRAGRDREHLDRRGERTAAQGVDGAHARRAAAGAAHDDPDLRAATVDANRLDGGLRPGRGRLAATRAAGGNAGARRARRHGGGRPRRDAGDAALKRRTQLAEDRRERRGDAGSRRDRQQQRPDRCEDPRRGRAAQAELGDEGVHRGLLLRRQLR